MLAQCSSYHFPATGRRTMTLVAIVVLLAAGLWFACPWWGAGLPLTTSSGQALAAAPAALATLDVAGTAHSSTDNRAADTGMAADESPGFRVFLPQIAVPGAPGTLLIDGPWTSLPAGAEPGLALDRDWGALTLQSDMTTLAFVLEPDAEQESFANAVWSMGNLDGRLYLGYGDYYNNRGPVDIVSYDPLSGALLQEMSDIPEEEARGWQGAPDGRLYVGGFDALESWEFGNFYENSGQGWQKRRTIYKGVHVHEVVSFQNRLYANFGSDGATFPVSYPYVLVSDDQGSSWLYEQVGQGEGKQSGVGSIEVVTHATGSFLYAVVQDWVTGDHLYRFDGQRWEEVRVSDPRGVFRDYRLMAFQDKLLVDGWVYAPDFSWWGQALFALDGRTQTEVTFLRDKKTRFCAAYDGWLYCAASEGNPALDPAYDFTLYRTRDAQTWETLGPVTLPPGASPQSLAFAHGRLYVGASGAFRWYADDGIKLWTKAVYPIENATLHWDAEVPEGAELSLQIRTAMGGSDADMAAQPLVGPDGTKQTAFTVSGQALHSRHNGHIFLQVVVHKVANGDGAAPILKWVALQGDNGTVTMAVDQGQGLYTAANSTHPAGAAYVSLSFSAEQPIAGARLFYDGVTPPQTSLRFQVRSGLTQDQVSERPFVGPDGTTATFYDFSGQSLWAGYNGDRFIQYRALLTSLDPRLSPFLRGVVLAPRSGALARFSVALSGSSAWIAGESHPVTVTARLADGGPMPIDGEVSLSAVDVVRGETVPVEPSRATLIDGVANVNISLQRATQTQIRVDLAGVRSCSPPIAVQPGAADTISMTTDLPEPWPNWSPVGQAGRPFGLSLAIHDRFGNVVSDYAGTVHCQRWSWQSEGDVLPPYTFQPADRGTHQFPAVVVASEGEWNLVCFDAAHPGTAGTVTVNVQPAPPAAGP